MTIAVSQETGTVPVRKEQLKISEITSANLKEQLQEHLLGCGLTRIVYVLLVIVGEIFASVKGLTSVLKIHTG